MTDLPADVEAINASIRYVLYAVFATDAPLPLDHDERRALVEDSLTWVEGSGVVIRGSTTSRGCARTPTCWSGCTARAWSRCRTPTTDWWDPRSGSTCAAPGPRWGCTGRPSSTGRTFLPSLRGRSPGGTCACTRSYDRTNGYTHRYLPGSSPARKAGTCDRLNSAGRCSPTADQVQRRYCPSGDPTSRW